MCCLSLVVALCYLGVLFVSLIGTVGIVLVIVGGILMEGVGMDELREAAKRGIKLYKESPDHVRQRDQCFLMGMFCDLWLKEHPEDDGEPVTEDWLRSSVGWIPVEGSGYIGRDGIIFCKGSESVYSAWLQISQYYYDMRRIVRVETRGDVRHLCKALGVSLVG